MPERSLEGRGGSATPSVDEEHRKGQLGRKEQQVRGHSGAGKGGAFREMEGAQHAGDYSSEK